VRALIRGVLNSLVGNEPCVAAATQVRAGVARGGPSRDVGLVLIGHSDGFSVQRHVSGQGEVEDVLMAVVYESAAVDRLVVADRNIALQPG
jgi:hypothetical protein